MECLNLATLSLSGFVPIEAHPLSDITIIIHTINNISSFKKGFMKFSIVMNVKFLSNELSNFLTVVLIFSIFTF